jgi:triosephosphate isomerase
MRKKIVAGNWKMNNTLSEAVFLTDSILGKLNSFDKIIKIIIPPFPYLESLSSKIGETENVYIGAQNCHTESNGAYTGEISAKMLQSVGCQYVLIGHSERRSYFNETNEELVLKIKEALLYKIKPIFCIGETLDQREGAFYFDVIKSQLVEVLSKFDSSEFQNIIIAYEPIWAIGTGLTATSNQAQEMHAFIRAEIAKLFSPEIAEKTSILYGGSCNAQNAYELFTCPDVDGGLIGGASLKADDFCAIINSF